ncbi:hypothetical protein AUR64_03865 [Haloprofundus marisrubri]|uniref:Uncharacterized protein n=1 Tax=Haloprofundus marisrubri TaxID=1514971 RepID=A0A0W1RD36_9EURY|nr:hypothetical protein AUR64_03865 [Haloprofundus marisrubri]
MAFVANTVSTNVVNFDVKFIVKSLNRCSVLFGHIDNYAIVSLFIDKFPEFGYDVILELLRTFSIHFAVIMQNFGIWVQ